MDCDAKDIEREEIAASSDAVAKNRALRLGDLTAARKTMARFISLFDKGEISERVYRAHAYGMGKLLDFMVKEKEAVDLLASLIENDFKNEYE